MKKTLFLFVAAGLIFTACKKDDNPVGPEPSAEAIVQDFMWKAMNLWYFWQAESPNLSDTKFSNAAIGNKDYDEFLASETDPEKFFDNKLRVNEDRFSFYNEDFKELTQALSGISKSNGLEFGLVRFSEGDDLFGYVRYIIPGSDASTKDISRGNLFTGVNGTTLTANNYRDLLFGDADTYVLNMATITDNTVTPNEESVSLTKQANLAENPVFLDKIFEISGTKIGYLVYNAFTNEYDEDLNAAFGRFKAGNVTELVLDMRYNPGGSVNTSRLLSSMIYGAKTTDLFLKQRWNQKVQGQLSASQLEDYFADKTDAGTALNTLNLKKVYVLATNSSASASELVINGLAPYVDVVHIGETTRGKNEFSITMVDDVQGSYIYNPDRENKIRANNKWAIQPLVGRNENADGFFDYTSGLVPDIKLEEDLGNLGVLGDQNEPLLARAIAEITGTSGRRDFTVKMPIKIMTSSKMFTPLKDNMYIDKLPIIQ